MTAFFVLDSDELAPLLEAARRLEGVALRRVGSYVEVSGDGPIEIGRRAAGLRHALWYSALAGVAAGRVVRFDSEALEVVPE